MRIKKSKSFSIVVSSSEKIIYNVGGSCISMFDINDESNIKKRFNELINISFIVVSNDEKFIAYKNTSGHIVVQNIETSEIVIKSNGLSKEGYDIFFLKNNKIITSTWEGQIFILDLNEKSINITFEFSLFGINMIKINDNDFIVFGDKGNEGSEIYEISVGEQNIVKHSFLAHKYFFAGISACYINNKAYFYSKNHEQNQTNIIIYSIVTKSISVFHPNEIDENQTGYFTFMCISKNEKYLIVALCNAVYIINMFDKKTEGVKWINYISSVRLISNDTKVIIGTWSGIFIFNLTELIQGSMQ